MWICFLTLGLELVLSLGLGLFLYYLLMRPTFSVLCSYRLRLSTF